MPYSTQHKQQTRAKIIESARVLFNRHGFQDVTIDAIMKQAGLTRGGFYKHFSSKESLYSAAVSSFLMGRGAQWRQEAGVDPAQPGANTTQKMITSYLSGEHLDDLDGQCPMIALPSDVSRSNPEVQAAYQKLLESMVHLFEQGVSAQDSNPRETALSLAALCVGGMVLARSLPDSALAKEIRLASLNSARKLV